MNYLLDKKMKKKKFLAVLFFAFIFFVLFYFRSDIWSGLSSVSHKIFRPVLVLGNNLGEKLKNLNSFFVSKNSLYLQNQDWRMKLAELEMQNLNYNSILAENVSLKEILGRKNEKTNLILSAILAKPDRSAYDTVVIDAGEKKGIEIQDMVYALGNVPIGRVSLVYDDSAKVTLFSNPGEKTPVVAAGDIFMEVVGRGGGNFEMTIPANFRLIKGDQVSLPGLNSPVLAVVETIISDPRDSSAKALLVSPVNIQELKFVEVKK